MRTTCLRSTLGLCVVLVALAAASGCFKATFIQPKTVAGIEHDDYSGWSVQRTVMFPAIAARRSRACALTSGLYNPQRITVRCAASGNSVSR